MKLKYIVLAAIMVSPAMMWARTLSPAEALTRAAADSGAPRAAAGVHASPQLVYTANTSAGEAAVYVFEGAARNSGYLILSADDCAQPVLGYSDSGSFDPDAIPPQMQWWLEEYGRQIEYMNACGISYSAPMRKARAAIAPQLKTDWDQGAPYNEQCPKYGADRTYTGCVATAMAQVLKYWNYPQRGTGSISYEASTIQKRLSLNFELRNFDWDNMIDTYLDDEWTEAQANAVAYLMKACGYSVKMDYGIDSSGALAMNISRALKRYFNYDGNLHYELRSLYSLSQWEDLIYDNLANVGPVIYGGASYIGGGHSFVCDGYDGNGYFHFNWGWTGMSNGYFSLDALNPYSLGTGGGEGGGYNFTQDAVLGIQPPTGKPVEEQPVTLVQHGNLNAEIAPNDSLKFSIVGEAESMWVNYNPETLKLMLGAIVERTDAPSTDTKVFEITPIRFNLEPGYGVAPAQFKPYINLKEAALADGTYKVTVACCRVETGEDEPWVPMQAPWGYSTSITLTKAGDSYTVTNSPLNGLVVTNTTIIGKLYYGMINRFRITVANPTDVELSRGFAPAIAIDGTLSLLGESIMVTVPPHESVTREWATSLYALTQYIDVSKSKMVQLAFFDETTYNFVGTGQSLPFVLQPNPGVPYMVTTGAPVITNGVPKTENFNGHEITVYEIDNPRDIQVECGITMNKGLFAYPVYACIAQPGQDDTGEIALVNYGGHPMFFDEVNVPQTFTTTLSYPALTPGQNHQIFMAFAYGSSLGQIGPDSTYLRLGASGVEDVAADVAAPVFDGSQISAQGYIEVYTTGGALVASGNGTVDTSFLAPGVYVARAGSSSIKICIK